jgi:hypothetical protein
MDESQSEAIDGAEICIVTGYLLWILTYVLVTELPYNMLSLCAINITLTLFPLT